MGIELLLASPLFRKALAVVIVLALAGSAFAYVGHLRRDARQAKVALATAVEARERAEASLLVLRVNQMANDALAKDEAERVSRVQPFITKILEDVKNAKPAEIPKPCLPVLDPFRAGLNGVRALQAAERDRARTGGGVPSLPRPAGGSGRPPA